MNQVKFLSILVIIFSSLCHGENLSLRAWKSIQPIYKKILEHPFNQQLVNGTLDKKIFNFYKQQDTYYLKFFSKSLTLLATKLEKVDDIKVVLDLAKNAFDEDPNNWIPDTSSITFSNFSYTNFLIATAAFKSKEELVAAILPCYWIYFKLASDLKKISIEENPYQTWINFYSSKQYESEVQKVIALFDKIGNSASSNKREKMLSAFKISSHLELGFWDDSFKMTNPFKISKEKI